MKRTDAFWLGLVLMAVAILGGMDCRASGSRTVTVAEPFELVWRRELPTHRFELRLLGDGQKVTWQAELSLSRGLVRQLEGDLAPRDAAELLQALDRDWTASDGGTYSLVLKGRGSERRCSLAGFDPSQAEAIAAVETHPEVRRIEAALLGG